MPAVSVDVDKPPMDGAGAADRASSGLQPPPLPGKDAARSGPRDTRSGSTLGQPDRDADQVAIAAAALRSLLSGVLRKASPILAKSVNKDTVVGALMREHCYDEASLRAILRRDPCFARFMDRLPEAPVALFALLAERLVGAPDVAAGGGQRRTCSISLQPTLQRAALARWRQVTIPSPRRVCAPAAR